MNIIDLISTGLHFPFSIILLAGSSPVSNDNGLFEFLKKIAEFVIPGSAIVGLLSYLSTRSKQRIEVAQRCFDKYKALTKEGIIEEGKTGEFLDLIDEEIFYIKKKMVSKVVRTEWMCNMVNYLPFFGYERKTAQIKRTRVFPFFVYNVDKSDIYLENPINQAILKKRKSVFAGGDYSLFIRHPKIMQILLIDRNISKVEVSRNLETELRKYPVIRKMKTQLMNEIKRNIRKGIKENIFKRITVSNKIRKFVLFFRMDLALQPTPEQMDAYMVAWNKWIGGITGKNQLVTGNHLSTEGKVLRPNNIISEGPYVEKSESVAGYIIIQAGDPDAAVEIAKSCPILEGFGTSVEVREAVER